MRLIGGWQIGGIFTHQTGQVGTPLLGLTTPVSRLRSATSIGPIQPGQSPYLSGSARSLNDWVNKAAYTPPTAGTFGTLQRGSFIGPGFTNLDASLHKVFNMPYNEKHQLAIRFEAFNSLNHPNWNNPTLSLQFLHLRPHQRHGSHAPVATRGEVPVLVRSSSKVVD